MNFDVTPYYSSGSDVPRDFHLRPVGHYYSSGLDIPRDSHLRPVGRYYSSGPT